MLAVHLSYKYDRNRFMKITELGAFEELVLITAVVLGSEAYTVTIAKELEDHSGKLMSISTIHTTLYRLEKKGFLVSKMGGATSERGGRQKRLFECTEKGMNALEKAKALRASLWQLIPKTS